MVVKSLVLNVVQVRAHLFLLRFFMKYHLIVFLDSSLLWKTGDRSVNLGISLSGTKQQSPSSHSWKHPMPRTRAALVLKAERPKLAQNLSTSVHHSLSSGSPHGHIYPFWWEDELIVKHPDSLRLSPRAAFGFLAKENILLLPLHHFSVSQTLAEVSCCPNSGQHRKRACTSL